LVLQEAVCGKLINDLKKNIDYTYEGWNPNIEVWRARESNVKELPYIVVDFISASRPKFQSLGDIIGEVDDIYHKFGYCEMELINISVCANKYHKDRDIRGNDFSVSTIDKIRKHVMGKWDKILNKNDAAVDRGIKPVIRNLSGYKAEIGTRWYEYDMDVYVRTGVRWDNKPEDEEESDERAEKAYILLRNDTDKNNIKVIYNG